MLDFQPCCILLGCFLEFRQISQVPIFKAVDIFKAHLKFPNATRSAAKERSCQIERAFEVVHDSAQIVDWYIFIDVFNYLVDAFFDIWIRSVDCFGRTKKFGNGIKDVETGVDCEYVLRSKRVAFEIIDVKRVGIKTL